MGRASDLEKLITMLNTLSALNTVPEDVRVWLNMENIIKLACAGADLSAQTVLETLEKVQQKMQAQADAANNANITKQLTSKASPEQLAQAAAQG